jgi:hypothetical protein
MKDVELVTRREYVGLSTCGCTAFALICEPKRKRHRALGWKVVLMASGPCHPHGLEGIGGADFATEADAIASIENGDWPEIVWVRAV